MVNAISFTGSSEVGRIVGQTAAGYFKPCSLEMGGKNAMIVLDDANLDLALDGAAVSYTHLDVYKRQVMSCLSGMG